MGRLRGITWSGWSSGSVDKVVIYGVVGKMLGRGRFLLEDCIILYHWFMSGISNIKQTASDGPPRLARMHQFCVVFTYNIASQSRDALCQARASLAPSLRSLSRPFAHHGVGASCTPAPRESQASAEVAHYPPVVAFDRLSMQSGSSKSPPLQMSGPNRGTEMVERGRQGRCRRSTRRSFGRMSVTASLLAVWHEDLKYGCCHR
jgi:hypothetical protein